MEIKSEGRKIQAEIQTSLCSDESRAKHLFHSPSTPCCAEHSVQSVLSSEANLSCGRAGEQEFLPNQSLPGDLGQAWDFHTEPPYPGPTAVWPQQGHGTKKSCPYGCHTAHEHPTCLTCLLLCPSTWCPSREFSPEAPSGYLQ